jgi:YD repeat-containing protein
MRKLYKLSKYSIIRVIYIVLFIFIVDVYSQNDKQIGAYTSEVVAPSVNEFNRYGAFEFDEYRGIAKVEIPLLNIKQHEFELPINLGYFNGGIKVGEESGIVGLGWTINNNLPVIMQTIKDIDDFAGLYFLNLPKFTGSHYYPSKGRIHPMVSQLSTWGMQSDIPFTNYSNLPHQFVTHFNFMPDGSNYVLTNKYERFLNDWGAHPDVAGVDSELDIFQVNIEGVNLKFVRKAELTEDYTGPSHLDSYFRLHEFANVNDLFEILDGVKGFKIKSIANSFNLFNGIEITSPSGIVYTFALIGNIYSQSFSSGYGTYSNSNNVSDQRKIMKKFYLSKVTTITNLEIIFDYEGNNVYELNKPLSSYYRRNSEFQTITNQQHEMPGTWVSDEYDGISKQYPSENINYYSFSILPSNTKSAISTTGSRVIEEYKFLKNIILPDSRVIFNYSNRVDYEGMKKLDNIQNLNIYNQQISNIVFNYSYFESDANAAQNFDKITKRLKLNNISINDKLYRFEYDDVSLPNKLSNSIDYWGYYNGKPNTSQLLNLNHLGYTQTNYPPIEIINDNNHNDFSANLNYTKASLLKRLIYPTGGYSEYVYELNKFDNYLFTSSNNINIDIGHGLRIKSIENYSNQNNIEDRIDFNYFGGKCIFKKRLEKRFVEKTLHHYHYELGGAVLQYPWFNIFTKKSAMIIEASLGNYLGSTLSNTQDYIGYDKVEIVNSNSGKTVRFFSNSPYSSIIIADDNKNRMNYIFHDRYFKGNGLLLKEEIRDSSNNLLKEETNQYTLSTNNRKRYSIKVSPYADYARLNAFQLSVANIPTYPLYNLTFYPVYANNVRLNKKTIKEYFGLNTVEKNINYLFGEYANKNAGHEILYEYNSANSGVTFVREDKYIGFIGDDSKNIFNKIGSIYEVNHFSNSDETEYFRGSHFTEINYDIMTMNPVNKSSYKGMNDVSYNKVSFDLFDVRGNLLQYHKENGIYISYIYAYNSTLPVAKIENMAYASIPVSRITAIQNATDTGTYDETNVRTVLDALRNDPALQNAMVSTYIHKPLVGVTSVTDPKGDTQTYEYDGFNRLKVVRDKEGNKLSENEYHYRPQN